MTTRLLAVLIAPTCLLADELDRQSPFDRHIVREWQTSEHPVGSRLGQQALRVNPEHWQHVQSRSFVLHFANKAVALRTAQEAEFYLTTIRESLGLEKLDPKRKSHIFIFESGEDWKEFTKTATIDPWTGGLFDGLDLFYWRKTGMGVLHSDQTLPHEIAHRALYEKFPAGSIPLALNEGFAEYHARKLAFRYLRPRGYDVRVISKRVPKDKFVGAETLVSATSYPSNDDAVAAFYDQSERLVNFFMEKHPPSKFMALLQALTEGQSFQLAFVKTYAGEYVSVDQLERAFAEYAILPDSK